MTSSRWFRAAFLMGALLLAGGTISAAPKPRGCQPCDPVACYQGCLGVCAYSSVFQCEICTCPPR